MNRSKVSRARIVRLYAKSKSPLKVSKIVKRHVSVVRYHLIKAGVLDCKW
jgi:intein-encoded DNA endonuclease-like protein